MLVVACLATMLAVSVAVAMLVYRVDRTPVGEASSIRHPDRGQLAALKKRPVLASPEETLRRLAAAEGEEARE
jgi:hypothetical protein